MRPPELARSRERTVSFRNLKSQNFKSQNFKSNNTNDSSDNSSSHNNDNNELYGQFSKLHVCFCGLDPGNLKFETVRTHKQHICF